MSIYGFFMQLKKGVISCTRTPSYACLDNAHTLEGSPGKLSSKSEYFFISQN